MIDLILDTSTDQFLIALSKNNQILDSQTLPHEQNLSKSFLPAIQDLLLKHSITFPELSKISVGVGPGSYTGTRISVAIAQSLSIALSIPLYPFCSLLAFLPPKLPQGPFAFILPSKHASWFLLKGYFEDGLIQTTLSQHILPKAEILPFLTEIPSLLAFDITSSPLDLSLEGTWLSAEPNLSLLIPYLNELKKSPPQEIEIIYLHNF